MTEQQVTEEELVEKAQNALNQCNWVIGECAAQWTQRYAQGRTDADFGARIGLSGDQVYQRRRVWETFADVHDDYPKLKWSHFYAALNWDDAADCLQWANEIGATVAEMKAWRRAQHGEDLTIQGEEGEPAPFDSDMESPVEYLAPQTGMVRDPESFGGGEGGDAGELVGAAAGSSNELTAAGHPRQIAESASASEEAYAPFSKGARGSAEGSDSEAKAAPSAEQVIKRLASAIERCNTTLTPAIIERFPNLPPELQQRFLKAVDDLMERSEGLR
ncbi:hypothetical protein Mal4_27280 [Maioricimonas rarisocia]|uniref:Uncharacterized protein n=1 Tax=Maioricimonas rarisocia TaxID=2528026 RepID=A0A517Z7I3_9PLAN|nr:hypothetical protein [Maioricimonas rarisocia]QDU38401.1 hypothetical protein Mal4_27280 [Maioricimonas rarisocia]